MAHRQCMTDLGHLPPDSDDYKAAEAFLALENDSDFEQQEENDGDEEEGVDVANFKGIYFGDKQEVKYTCPETGAHFEFRDMHNRILKAQKWRNALDIELGVTYEQKVPVIQQSQLKRNPQPKAAVTNIQFQGHGRGQSQNSMAKGPVMTEGDQRIPNKNDFQNYIQQLKKKIQGRNQGKGRNSSDKNTIENLSMQKILQQKARAINPSLVYQQNQEIPMEAYNRSGNSSQTKKEKRLSSDSYQAAINQLSIAPQKRYQQQPKPQYNFERQNLDLITQATKGGPVQVQRQPDSYQDASRRNKSHYSSGSQGSFKQDPNHSRYYQEQIKGIKGGKSRNEQAQAPYNSKVQKSREGRLSLQKKDLQDQYYTELGSKFTKEKRQASFSNEKFDLVSLNQKKVLSRNQHVSNTFSMQTQDILKQIKMNPELLNSIKKQTTKADHHRQQSSSGISRLSGQRRSNLTNQEPYIQHLKQKQSRPMTSNINQSRNKKQVQAKSFITAQQHEPILEVSKLLTKNQTSQERRKQQRAAQQQLMRQSVLEQQANHRGVGLTTFYN